MKKVSIKRGFTLVELLVVISIIGTLSTVVVASLNNARHNAHLQRMYAEVRQLHIAAEVMANANGGQYPANICTSGAFFVQLAAVEESCEAAETAGIGCTVVCSYHPSGSWAVQAIVFSNTSPAEGESWCTSSLHQEIITHDWVTTYYTPTCTNADTEP